MEESSRSDDRCGVLIRTGWEEIKNGRPIAAWSCWRRALAINPEARAAAEALRVLAGAHDLPDSARKEYRFRAMPDLPAVALGDDPHALERALEELTTAAPESAPAWFNLGLIRAWAGKNREAIQALDRAGELDAANDLPRACESWRLAEILRQGAGAETVCDDLSHSLIFEAEDAELVAAVLARVGEVRPLNADIDEVWSREPADSTRLPRALASVIRSGELFRIMSPDPRGVDLLDERLTGALGGEMRNRERMASPLPMPIMDSAIWTARINEPDRMDPSARAQAVRESIEDWFENVWITLPRHALAGLAPREAAERAKLGDRAMEARLTAIVAVREELAARPASVPLYQGYPFDRLRRRLGLEPLDRTTLEAADLSCASQGELRSLAVDRLSVRELEDAFRSSLAFRDDALSSGFARELLKEGVRTRLRILELVAPLVRLAAELGDREAAVAFIDGALVRSGADRGELLAWKGELLARHGEGEAAGASFRTAMEQSPGDCELPLRAAESLAGEGEISRAREFVELAIDLAQAAGDRAALALARRIERSLDAW